MVRQKRIDYLIWEKEWKWRKNSCSTFMIRVQFSLLINYYLTFASINSSLLLINSCLLVVIV